MSLSDWGNWAQIVSVPLAVVLALFATQKAWKKWRKVFWVTAVISGLFLAYRFGWFHWLVKPVTLATWFLILIVLCSLAVSVTGLIVFKLVQNFQGKSELKRVFTVDDYRSDIMFGCTWMWNYYRGGNINERSIIPYCPKPDCKCKLDAREDYHRHPMNSREQAPVTLSCVHCGNTIKSEFTWDELHRRVMLEIDRRIQTREYLTHLESHFPASL
jgi:hypothetical protein